MAWAALVLCCDCNRLSPTPVIKDISCVNNATKSASYLLYNKTESARRSRLGHGRSRDWCPIFAILRPGCLTLSNGVRNIHKQTKVMSSLAPRLCHPTPVPRRVRCPELTSYLLLSFLEFAH